MKSRSAILGAAFLMATSAVGPGFLTQTSLFTSQLMASFGFVILISVLLDIGVQLNIWRIVAVSGKRAQDLANAMLPGLGHVLATMIGLGGLIFNIGNIAGGALGLHVLTGMPIAYGGLITALLALGLFWFKEAGMAMDKVARIGGSLMILLMLYVVFISQPPLGEALQKTFWPEQIDSLKIITLVGGTVGGYISFAGAHRLLDAGITGTQNLSAVTKSAVNGIMITSVMRYLLFLAALGVVWGGVSLDPSNPAATVFQSPAGQTGYYIFGIVMWSAATTSIVGASYTSLSFWKTLSPWIARHDRKIISAFILLSALIFAYYGQPVKLLIYAGALNGLILPLALGVMLLAIRKYGQKHGYRHPRWLYVAGWLVALVLGGMAFSTLGQL